MSLYVQVKIVIRLLKHILLKCHVEAVREISRSKVTININMRPDIFIETFFFPSGKVFIIPNRNYSSQKNQSHAKTSGNVSKLFINITNINLVHSPNSTSMQLCWHFNIKKCYTIFNWITSCCETRTIKSVLNYSIARCSTTAS